MNQQSFPIPSDAISALERGNKVEAIKITRDTEWMTLKQAKLATEAFLEANPSLKQKCEQHNRPGNGVMLALMLVAGVAIAATLLL